jgi:Family of unknown function (DUF5681)
MTSNSSNSDDSNSTLPRLVGYKNPPVETRFKKGESGNPKGCPRKPRDLAKDVARELRRKVTSTIDGPA